MFNAKKLKTDFPFFSAPKNKNTVYLDNAATTQKPQAVIDALVDFYTNHNANVHRTLYELGEGATIMYEAAREKVERFINAKHPEEIIFTKGATEGINFVAATWARANLRAGDEILLSQAEHHANLLPWQHMAQVTGAKLSFIELDPAPFMLKEPRLNSATKLVAITHDSNVLGPVWGTPDRLKKVIAAAHQAGAKVLVDAAQVMAHHRLDVQDLGADFVVFSGHKMFGPTGIGVLYIKRELHDHIPPYQRGGSMVNSVSYTDATWAPAPQKFEAGTPPIAAAIGLRAAIDYLTTTIDFDELAKHETKLCTHLIAGLEALPAVTVAGNKDLLRSQGHLVCFAIAGVHAHDMAAYLSSHGIAARAGHHCAQPLAKLLGFESLVRVSFALYNTVEDVTRVLEGVEKGIKFLG